MSDFNKTDELCLLDSESLSKLDTASSRVEKLYYFWNIKETQYEDAIEEYISDMLGDKAFEKVLLDDNSFQKLSLLRKSQVTIIEEILIYSHNITANEIKSYIELISLKEEYSHGNTNFNFNLLPIDHFWHDFKMSAVYRKDGYGHSDYSKLDLYEKERVEAPFDLMLKDAIFKDEEKARLLSKFLRHWSINVPYEVRIKVAEWFAKNSSIDLDVSIVWSVTLRIEKSLEDSAEMQFLFEATAEWIVALCESEYLI